MPDDARSEERDGSTTTVRVTYEFDFPSSVPEEDAIRTATSSAMVRDAEPEVEVEQPE